MIKVEGRKVEISASPLDASVELSMLVGCIYEFLNSHGIGEDDAKSMIRESCELGLLSKEERSKKLLDEFVKFAKQVNGNGDEENA